MDIQIILDSVRPDMQNIGTILDWWMYSRREYPRLDFSENVTGNVEVECVSRNGAYLRFYTTSVDDCQDVRVRLDSARPDSENIAKIFSWWKCSQRQYVRLKFVEHGDGLVTVECYKNDGKADFWTASIDAR